MKHLLSILVLTITFTGVMFAEFYKLEDVRRIDKDLYKTRSGLFIETRYCYHYTYGEDAIYNDSTQIIIWEDGEKCDVKRVFR